MTAHELKIVLDNHRAWLTGTGGQRAGLYGANLTDANLTCANLTDANLTCANLTRADLTDANLTCANLTDANLTCANLTRADLTRANLYGAHLIDANLTCANLYGAHLYGANLYGADLTGAHLTDANLYGAHLYGANLYGANLTGAKLPHFQIPQDGSLIVWKKLACGMVCKLLIPARAKRTACLVGRKCRAKYAKVLVILDAEGHSHGECGGWRNADFLYRVGETVHADSYDPDIRLECSHGIHFFLTREEAEEFD